ncbi:hypothetical protein NC651_031100 [Populus alba x Populus x berolinensis]|nr:hypothetical protein NC651_031100 [Populus alba x Populus x berolinensis]
MAFQTENCLIYLLPPPPPCATSKSAKVSILTLSRRTSDGKTDRGRPKIVRKNAGSRSSSLSCKYSCSVAGYHLARMSQFSTPISKSEGAGKGHLLGSRFASR